MSLHNLLVKTVLAGFIGHPFAWKFAMLNQGDRDGSFTKIYEDNMDLAKDKVNKLVEESLKKDKSDERIKALFDKSVKDE